MLQQSTRQTLPSPTSRAEQPVVVVVDDDASIREGLSELIQSVGLAPLCFASTQELLASWNPQEPGCLILDVRMPGTSGLDFQRGLAASGNTKPIIFLTGHGDIPMTVQAMKAGAVDFLTKPVRDQALLDAIAIALERDRQQRATAEIARRNIELANMLTPRERGVLKEVVNGRLNKQIAHELGISEVTVKVHRSAGMKKMRAATVGDLIIAWQTLQR